MRSMFSMISVKRRTGSLEGTHRLTICVLLHARLECAFLDQMDGLAEEISDLVFDPDHIQ